MQKLKIHQSQLEKFHHPESEVRPWGRWSVLNTGPGYKVKLLEVLPGHRLSLQYHFYRAEHWVVVSGKARVEIGFQVFELGVMQSLMFGEGTIHRIENPFAETLLIIEVQHGSELSETDIVRLEDDYNRTDMVAGGGA